MHATRCTSLVKFAPCALMRRGGTLAQLHGFASLIAGIMASTSRSDSTSLSRLLALRGRLASTHHVTRTAETIQIKGSKSAAPVLICCGIPDAWWHGPGVGGTRVQCAGHPQASRSWCVTAALGISNLPVSSQPFSEHVPVSTVVAVRSILLLRARVSRTRASARAMLSAPMNRCSHVEH